MKTRVIKNVMTHDKPEPLCGARMRHVKDGDPAIEILRGFRGASHSGLEYAGELGGTMPTRGDGATRAVLCSWTQNWDVEIVEENGTKYFIAWVLLQGGEGGPQSMFSVDPITKRATSVVGDSVQRKPRVAQSNVAAVTMTKSAKKALDTIGRNTSEMRSINEMNAKFYGVK